MTRLVAGNLMLSIDCASCKKENKLVCLEGGKKFACVRCGAKNIIIDWGGGFKTRVDKL